MQANKKIEEKIDAMIKHRSYILKKIYLDEKIFHIDDKELKIGYLNINGLLDGNHYEYFNADKNLSSLDLIVLSESKLNSKCTNAMLENYIDNWKILGRFDSDDQKKHMDGITQEVHPY